MDVRRRNGKALRPSGKTAASGEQLNPQKKKQASDALPLPLYLTNAVFFALFFSVAYFLLHRWRDKIRNSMPLHVVTLSELAAVGSLFVSGIYLLGFFGIDFVQSVLTGRAPTDGWEVEEDVDSAQFVDDSRLGPCGGAVECSAVPPKVFAVLEPPSSEEDEEIIKSVVAGKTPSYSLESKLGDCKRAAAIRREALQRVTGKSLAGLPLNGFDYESILGQCCEMPIGYVQIPVGIAGPLLLDEIEYSVPMATTEGCLVASTNRGCKAIYSSGGATSVLLKDGMTRAPVVRFSTARRAADLKFFLEDPMNFDTLSVVFSKSSRFARLQDIKCTIAGKNLYMRFSCTTGDAMGMNMVSKGVQNVLDYLRSDFSDMDVIGISGNFCSDKKPAAVNWIEGRGKSVVCEAIIKEEVVRKVLKTNVGALVELNMLKNLTGSAMAGALGGFNAHASNIVSAVYIATGQDPAQNVESSHCITMMEAVNDGKDLHISVTMPSIEVWDTRQRTCCNSFSVHEEYISDMTFASDSNKLVGTSGDGTLSVCNLRSNKVQCRSEFSEEELLSAVIMKNGRKLICGTQSGTLLLYSWGFFKDCSDRFVDLAPNSIDAMLKLDEDRVITGSENGLISVVGILPNRIIQPIAEHAEYPIERLAFSHDKKFLGSISHDLTLKLWDMDDLLQVPENIAQNQPAEADSDSDMDEMDTDNFPNSSKGAKTKVASKEQGFGNNGFFNDLE